MRFSKKTLDTAGQIMVYFSSVPHNEVIVLPFFKKGQTPKLASNEK